MFKERDIYGKRALDFVESLRKLTDYNEIRRCIINEIGWFGFDCVSVLSVPLPGEQLADCVLLNNRPTEFVDRYIQNNYINNDPAMKELQETVTPFAWSDILLRRKLSRAELAILGEARDFGAIDGFVVPNVTQSGSVVIFSFGGLEPNLSNRARAAVEIIAMFSLKFLAKAVDSPLLSETGRTPLMPIEGEILKWVAVGKSDDEIADILSLTAQVVAWHVASAKRKLDALRRPYAVAQAIRLGEISL
jgi:LuxR family quorum sensing-dependent transcriptional regulator